MDAPGSAPVDAPLAAPVDALLLPRRWTRQFRPRLSRLSEPLWATAATAVGSARGIDIPQKTLIILIFLTTDASFVYENSHFHDNFVVTNRSESTR